MKSLLRRLWPIGLLAVPAAATVAVSVGHEAPILHAQTTCDPAPTMFYSKGDNWCYSGGNDCIGCVVRP